MSEAVAVIPARGGSKRLPGKNLAPFRGRPMIAWTIAAARDSGLFGEIYVTTEDAAIADVARAEGAALIDRPADLATDTVSLTAVLDHALRGLPSLPPAACLLMPNCPLRTGEDIKAAARRFEETGADVTMSVVGYGWRPPEWALADDDGVLRPAFWRDVPAPTDARAGYVCPTGAIRWVRVARFLEEPTFYPARLTGHELAWHHAVDIDELADLEVARCVAHALDHGFAFEAAS